MIRRADSGQVALYFAVMVAVWLVFFGMMVIGGGRIREYQRADNCAAEAARVAGQAIDPATAIPGGRKRIDPIKAQQVVTTYLAAVGATGTATVDATGQRVTVTTVVPYRNPIRASWLGGDTWQATGKASATLLEG